MRRILVVIIFGIAQMVAAKTITVESTAADYTLTASEVVELIDSDEDLVKKGGGRLIIDKSLKGYKGEIRVEDGYLLALHNEAFGDTDKGTVIFSDATLEFKDDSANGVLKFGKEQITVSGIGVNGCGALCHVGTVKSQWCAVFQRVKLAGDTRFGGIPYNSNGECKRWDIRGGQGTFDMQGYNLEIKCNFGIAGADVVNPGNITVSGAKSHLCLEGSNARLNGSAENTLTIGEGAVLSSQLFKPAINWSVVIDGGTFLEQKYADDYVNYARIDGPVTITEKGAKFQASTAGGHWSFGGSLTINGEISVGGSVDAVMLCMDGDVEKRIPEYHALRSKIDKSKLDSQLRVRLYVVSGANGELPSYSADISDKRFDLDLVGESRLALTGNQDAADYRQHEGYVKITGEDKLHRFKDLVISGSSILDVSDAGTIDIHTNSLSVGALYPSVAKMRIFDTSLVTNWADRAKGGSLDINIGPVRKMNKDGYEISNYYRGRGILEICDGAVVSNVFNIGRVVTNNEKSKNSMCHGSLFVRGGTVAMVGSNITDEFLYNRIGSSGSGYVEISGGKVSLCGTIYPACGEYGCGLWYQKGGEVEITSSSLIFGQYSRNYAPSRGVYYQTGGTLESIGGLVFGKTLYDTSNAGNCDQFTLAGGEMNVNSAIDLAGAPNAKTTVNLNGGTLRVMFMQVLTNENQTIIGTGANTTLTNTYAWINFNGGIYSYVHRTDKLTSREAYKSESFFYGDPARMRITSYAGGAILDTAGHDRNLNHTITSPSGNGLVSLALPENVQVQDWMFAGAPYVEIEGDGAGASAVAEFDSVNGRLTGFTVLDYPHRGKELARHPRDESSRKRPPALFRTEYARFVRLKL